MNPCLLPRPSHRLYVLMRSCVAQLACELPAEMSTSHGFAYSAVIKRMTNSGASSTSWHIFRPGMQRFSGNGEKDSCQVPLRMRRPRRPRLAKDERSALTRSLFPGIRPPGPFEAESLGFQVSRASMLVFQQMQRLRRCDRV